MPRLSDLTQRQREHLLEDVVKLFQLFCEQEFNTVLYDYQLRVARALLSSIFVKPVDVFIKISRQAGKTETFTLVFKFLIIYFVHFVGHPLMAGIASPKGEQAKTDIDRIKKSIQVLRDRWGLEDTENNQATVRAYRHGKLCCEMFKFSLMPTTSNESKTLNVLAIEESHKADHKKRSDELDPMLASTGGVTWHIGVGATVVSDFTRGCNGELPDSVSIKCDVDEVIRDRRKRYEETNDPIHLAYEHKFEAELRKKGRQNPEIRRNYYLEDTVEEGNFISRERLVSCARPSNVIVPTDKLFLGGDWARRSDHTWFAIGNDKNDIIDWLKVPHAPYEEQVQIAKEWLYADRVAGVILTESWRYAATPQEERAMRQMKCCVQVQASRWETKASTCSRCRARTRCT